MIDSKLRSNVQPVFNFLAKGLIKIGLTPNIITVIAFILGIGSALAIGMRYSKVALVLLWLSGLLDVLDGSVARLTKSSSPKGAYMDLILDRMVEAAVILGLYHAYPEHAWMYLIFFVAVLFNFTTFIVAGALFSNEGEKSMHYDVGIAERTETFIVFSMLIVLKNFIFPILLVFNSIIFITGIIRFIKVMTYKK